MSRRGKGRSAVPLLVDSRLCRGACPAGARCWYMNEYGCTAAEMLPPDQFALVVASMSAYSLDNGRDGRRPRR
jgi:hypothetical protein